MLLFSLFRKRFLCLACDDSVAGPDESNSAAAAPQKLRCGRKYQNASAGVTWSQVNLVNTKLMGKTRFRRFYATSPEANKLPFSQEPLVDPRVIQAAVRNRLGRKRLRLIGDTLVIVCSIAVAGTILGRAYGMSSKDSAAPSK